MLQSSTNTRLQEWEREKNNPFEKKPLCKNNPPVWNTRERGSGELLCSLFRVHFLTRDTQVS